jgi:Uma2 family endonuclease
VSTITSPPRPALTPTTPIPLSPAGGAAVIMGEQRIALRDVSWDLYILLSDAIGERQSVYLAFDGRDLEIMTKGRIHEVYRERLARIINAMTFELRIRCRGVGETTWKRPEIARGLEADLGYYFTPEKLAADSRSLARMSRDIADYPNPDMAVEIDISPPEVDRPAIYAALKVTEVWRFGEESMVIEHLQPDGTYAPSESSRFLPVRAEEVYRWVAVEDSSDELAWEQRLREWIRAELAPRRGA